MKHDIPQKVRQEVLERDSHDGCPCCINCGHPSLNGKGLHLHHVKRRSQGGQHDPKNLVTLCFECHTDLHNGDSSIQAWCEEYLETYYGGIQL